MRALKNIQTIPDDSVESRFRCYCYKFYRCNGIHRTKHECRLIAETQRNPPFLNHPDAKLHSARFLLIVSIVRLYQTTARLCLICWQIASVLLISRILDISYLVFEIDYKCQLKREIDVLSSFIYSRIFIHEVLTILIWMLLYFYLYRVSDWWVWFQQKSVQWVASAFKIRRILWQDA